MRRIVAQSKLLRVLTGSSAAHPALERAEALCAVAGLAAATATAAVTRLCARRDPAPLPAGGVQLRGVLRPLPRPLPLQR